MTLRRLHTASLLVAALALSANLAFGLRSASAVDAPVSAAASATPARIVSVGGAVTEILYALGLESKIVGVDVTSLYPPEALKQKPNVGYMRQLSPEGILGLNPQLILAIEGSGPNETLAVLKDAKVPLMTVPEVYSDQGILDKIKLISEEMGVKDRGACLASAVSTDLTSVHALRDHVTNKLRVMFVMSLVNGRAMVAGHKTAANAIIDLAGGINAIGDYDGYKPVSEEAIAAANPDVILTMQRGADSVTSDMVFANPAFAMTPAAKTRAFVAMDGLYLLGFGPRTAAAAHDLAGRLYPELSSEKDHWTSRVLTTDCRH